jgi:predicted metalloprotease with PDZ domain
MIKRILGLLAFGLTAFSAFAQTRMAYEISFPRPHTHYAEVSLQLTGLNSNETELHLPVWTPGSYLIREFPRNVDSFRARNSRGPLASEKTSKSSWRIQHQAGDTVWVNYRVYAFEMSVRTSYIDPEHAYINGTTLFMYEKNSLQQPIEVRFVPHADWKQISSTLPQVNNDPWLRLAENYDQLVDCPVEIGNHREFSFMAAGMKHRIAMFGIDKYDEKKLKKDYTRIIEQSQAIFGDRPINEYLFIVHHLEQGGGGLEHSSSTTLQTRKDVYESEKSYTGFLGLVAHEYFHLWNVKRLRPIELGPFDYSRENYTHNLWFSEGFTSYYDNLLVRRAGLMKEAEYLEVLRSGMENIHANVGDAVQSLAESSWDAWIKFYLRNENSSNITVSYYRKGAMLGLVWDLAILQASEGRYGLDSLMKQLYYQYAVEAKRGYTDAELRQALVGFVGEAEARTLWDAYVMGTEKIDFNRYLAYAGLHIEDKRSGDEPYLGMGYQKSSNRLFVTSLRAGSAAENAGIQVNDILLQLDGEEIVAFDKWLEKKKPGESFNFIVYRQGKQIAGTGTIDAYPAARYQWRKTTKRTLLEQQIYDKTIGKR